MPILVGVGHGPSMKPSYGELSIKVFSGYNYHQNLERGQCISYLRINNEGKKITPLKRIIGLPGEKVQIIDGIPHINDVPLNEPYVLKENNVLSQNIDPIILSEDEYFVLGDNRDHSLDSRFIGPINKKDIIGINIFHFNLIK